MSFFNLLCCAGSRFVVMALNPVTFSLIKTLLRSMKVIKCEKQPRINFESLMNHNKYGHTIFGDTKRLQAESGKIFSRLNDI